MTRRTALVLGILVCGVVCFFPLLAPRALADKRVIAATAGLGSGLAFGGSQGSTVMTHSPLFLQMGARTFVDSEPVPAWNFALRMEIDGRTSIGGVASIDAEGRFGGLRGRIAAGGVVFVAPFTMAGPEVATTWFLPLGEHFSVGASLAIDAFLLGSDLPHGAVVVMLNGAAFAELTL